MSIMIRYAIVSVTLFGLLAHNGLALQPDPIATTVDAAAAKAKVLAWIDDFREDQVLFHDEDVASLRTALAEDSPEEAQRWWSNTTRTRAELESPQWQETREWFREFLRVQAILSDERIDDLRTRAWNAAGQESSREFRDILAEVKGYRTELVRGAADGEAMREYKLNRLAAVRKQQSSRQPYVAKAASFATKHTLRTPVRLREPRYVVRPPLVTSLEVARWKVVRLFWFF